jgi:membrane-bound lytic murein transglycosylase B
VPWGNASLCQALFLQFAVDYNKDGKHDIWNEQADVFASIANYLKSLGWKESETWGRAVKVPDSLDRNLMDLKVTKSVSEWKKLGVRNANGSMLPDSDIEGSVALVGEGSDAKTYLVYHNFKALLQWNRSRFFATAVGTLADEIGD